MLLAPAWAVDGAELAAMAGERQRLGAEIEQYEKTIALLHSGETDATESENAAVRTLAAELATLREQLVEISHQETALLQAQLPTTEQAIEPPAEPQVPQALESKPLRTHTAGYTLAEESEQAAHLHRLLQAYYSEEQEASITQPSAEEQAAREAAQRDARRLSRIPFNANKVRLTGAEGSTALGQISERLANPDLPEARRDTAPICSIKTRLFGAMIANERRSLLPVGKHHYIARLRLQPGDTTLVIQEHRWEIRLPQDVSASEFLVTLYRPPGTSPELHIFAVEDLLAEEGAHIPAWLPPQLQLTSGAG